ncbi:ferrous iron transport protein B [Pseudobutyrivibrio xylanivorans]|uniref:Ferrous iron transport protein B n=1 Tax=Pseudobutyrivibrio xylanivorans TaxID=185007 RepID=A0A5P6VPA5_PSEXY|nr:ferrous iron transport protein B [Pseudobutyrivibrio xylanivorans]QFJ53519.1 ferrous iron transport protein B [Pseudobutyrivibrio xylanivorans]
MSTATIALLGQPNSGKSTLFNALTGMRQHVGNWPGKTVEKKEGSFTYAGKEYNVADLPGSYSLSANSDEEVITRDFITSGKADVVCILADSSQLQRSLFMLADYAGINAPCFLLLNMADVAADQGKKIDAKAIEEKLGIPVIPFSATDLKSYTGFYKTLEKALSKGSKLNVAELEKQYDSIRGYQEICNLIPENTIPGYSSMWLATKVLENDKVVIEKLKQALGAASFAAIEEIKRNAQGAVAVGGCKFAWIDDVIAGAVEAKTQKVSLGKLDRIYTSKRWGKLAVVLTVLLGLIASFIPALPLMFVGEGVLALKGPVNALLIAIDCHEFVRLIVTDVIIQSFSYIFKMLGFVFGVTLVFGLLEEVGIMARISYVFDNTMGKLGLQGKSVMPFLVSFGCTMGGAAGSRVIDNWGQKVLTIALAWAVPCGAAWATIPMLASIFFGPGAVLVIVVILLTMLLHMWVTAKVFGAKLVQKEDRYGMIMELPPYHKPKWGALFRYVFGRTKETFVRVTRVVLLVCGVFWLLSYSPSGTGGILYTIGVVIEPVTKLFGMPWQLFLSYIASAVGKEGAVGVISALYSGGSYSTAFTNAMSGAGSTAAITGPGSLSSVLLANVSKPEALAFIFAMTFNMPCVVALAATYQETHSAKWTGRIVLYYTVVSLILAFIAYHIGLLIW